MAILSNFPAAAAVPLISILSHRRSDDLYGAHHHELEMFLRHVAESFSDVPGDLLSLRWIGNLLDALLSSFEVFIAVLRGADRATLAAAPMARILAELFDRGVKALDVCNAARNGAAEIRERRRLLDIAVASIGGGAPLSNGRLRRARKVLADLGAGDSRQSVLPRRNRSFGNDDRHHRRTDSVGGGEHRRSRSWSFSSSWSTARRMSSLAAPRGHEMAATEGLAVAAYAMGQVLVVVMCSLAAAFPSRHDRGIGAAAIHFSSPRGFPWWSAPIASLHERILDEARKKKEDKQQQCSSDGLLKELREMERRCRRLTDLVVTGGEEEEAEIKRAAAELQEVSDALSDDELQRVDKQIRDVFHCILRLRKEGLDGSPNFTIPFQ